MDNILSCLDDETLSMVISSCPNLIYVDLSYLSIGNKSILALANCVNLTYFKALGPYKFDPQNFKKFLSSCIHLRTISIILKTGTPETCRIQDLDILSPLYKNNLTILDLRRHNFPDDLGLQKIVAASYKTLQQVDFSFIRCISDETIKQLTKCINLTSVKIKSCDLITEPALNELSRVCISLENVNFSGCNISDLTIEYLLSADKPNIHTLEIDMCVNLTSMVIPVICAKKNLRALCISLKFINSDHVIKIAQELTSLLYLQVLPTNSLPKKPSQNNSTNTVKPESENYGHETYSQFIQEVCSYLPNSVIILES